MNDPVTDDSNEQRNKKQKIGFVLAFCCLISRWVILAFTTVLHLEHSSGYRYGLGLRKRSSTTVLEQTRKIHQHVIFQHQGNPLPMVGPPPPLPVFRAQVRIGNGGITGASSNHSDHKW
ncbi:hypothetical protein NEUTE1DRAFT_101243 [Neurospora tetrasperma FGSC 2508]|uniref:Transmembrane protein n=1 Tax=Neurospora tetrasperma (strain FGSC 2508 / ATCC MYA-4615 / P0657) TaxID=510951 RepID=F8MLC1_NEUT8|nr:uncharacterized protein NEUTE1DRAFT_101243 [Neurospora tetrasperma FGSC 2508]EGO58394.1 hypothetical protein NEUTE1DRAFT_101243 [Neurospora tetrasperma FGSC 2508]EGZ71277.1 hypothetical protein NEUTE2DRAFT_128672 [Neurospora tetrasperma FGSC 2509]